MSEPPTSLESTLHYSRIQTKSPASSTKKKKKKNKEQEQQEIIIV
jgi:hypothetical protein